MLTNPRSLLAFILPLLVTLFLLDPLDHPQANEDAQNAQEAQGASIVPPWVKIEDLRWGGSGCPSNSESVKLHILQERDAMRLTFPPLSALSGPNVPRTEMLKNCLLRASLSVPKGWSFTIFKATYRGEASLDKSLTGVLSTTYFYEGERDFTVLHATLKDPSKKDAYEVSDTIDRPEATWSPCYKERALLINTTVRVSPQHKGSAEGEIDLNRTRLGLKWRRCN